MESDYQGTCKALYNPDPTQKKGRINKSTANQPNNMKDQKKLRDHFLGWQCRLRQHAVRNADGRPSTGMQATITPANNKKQFGPVNMGLVKKDPAEITSEFQHLVKKTHDPNLRQEGAIKLLSSAYYQYPKEFDDCLTATFAIDSEFAQQLIEAGACELHFEQHQQQFTLQSKVKSLSEKNAAYQSTYWHNRLFNPVMPASINVLKFKINWRASTATPALS